MTPARLRPFRLVLPDATLQELADLYDWNVRAGLALLEIVGYVEIVTRNAIVAHLQRRVREDTNDPDTEWYARTDWFTAKNKGKIAQALTAAAGPKDATQPITSDRVVAQLSMGFWRLPGVTVEHSSSAEPSTGVTGSSSATRARSRTVSRRRNQQ